MQNHRFSPTMGAYRELMLSAAFLQEAADELYRNIVSSQIPIWAHT